MCVCVSLSLSRSLALILTSHCPKLFKLRCSQSIQMWMMSTDSCPTHRCRQHPLDFGAKKLPQHRFDGVYNVQYGKPCTGTTVVLQYYISRKQGYKVEFQTPPAPILQFLYPCRFLRKSSSPLMTCQPQVTSFVVSIAHTVHSTQYWARVCSPTPMTAVAVQCVASP